MTSFRAVLGFLAALPLAACFDSDETFAAVGTSTTGEPATTTSVDPTTGTTTSGTTGEPEVSCQNAITCIFQCALDLQQQMLPEPDLACFLDCIEVLSTDQEALKLLKLANCASDLCEAEGECMTAEEPTGTGSSSSGDESSSSSTAAGDEGPPPLIDPCVSCIFAKMLDEQTPGCEEFAMACN